MSRGWITEQESKNDIEIFLCGGETNHLSENDKKIILGLIEMLKEDEVVKQPDASKAENEITDNKTCK